MDFKTQRKLALVLGPEFHAKFAGRVLEWVFRSGLCILDWDFESNLGKYWTKQTKCQMYKCKGNIRRVCIIIRYIFLDGNLSFQK